mmetsp:Transcript_3715/g.6107  ORF Transcript_3715/g.6107 Transcript_3715/m.6107 type:complete len:214 (-) Transcript_3715:101-742(-)
MDRPDPPHLLSRRGFRGPRASRLAVPGPALRRVRVVRRRPGQRQFQGRHHPLLLSARERGRVRGGDPVRYRGEARGRAEDVRHGQPALGGHGRDGVRNGGAQAEGEAHRRVGAGVLLAHPAVGGADAGLAAAVHGVAGGRGGRGGIQDDQGDGSLAQQPGGGGYLRYREWCHECPAGGDGIPECSRRFCQWNDEVVRKGISCRRTAMTTYIST